MNEPTERRSYRLSPLDETGLMFGRSFGQLLIASIGVTLGAVLLLTAGLFPGLLVGGVAVGFGLTSINRRPLHAWVGHAFRWSRQMVFPPSPWFSAVPLVGHADEPVPAPLDRFEVVEVDAGVFELGPAGERVVLIRDSEAGLLSVSMRVSGRQFQLADPGDQDWLIAQWGTALQAAVADRPVVSSIRWSEWSGPTTLHRHRDWVAAHARPDPIRSIVDGYADLVDEAEQRARVHEVLVTLTIDTSRVDGRGRRDERAIERACTEAGLLARRLRDAGLQVTAPLSPAAWARAMRVRLDPATQPVVDRLTETLGVESNSSPPIRVAPTATQTDWRDWQCDDAFHRSFVVADWPRVDVSAVWMSELLRWSGTVRSITAVFEPVPRAQSFARITRAAGKLTSDEETRHRDGWRVGAQHRRARQALDEREEELVAGFGEFRYAGLITLTASSRDELDAGSEQVSHVAAGLGIELRLLNGRHPDAAIVALPLAVATR